MKTNYQIVFKQYFNLRNNIYVENDRLFYNDRLIIPKSCKKLILKTLHKGHLGINITINKAKYHLFWPKMTISEFIKQCHICEKFMPSNYKQPLLPHSVPKLN